MATWLRNTIRSQVFSINTTEITETGTTTTVGSKPIIKLMYYLHCVRAVLPDFDSHVGKGFNPDDLVDYRKRPRRCLIKIPELEKDEIVRLAHGVFHIKNITGKGLFWEKKDIPILSDNDNNSFFDIGQIRRTFNVAQAATGIHPAGDSTAIQIEQIQITMATSKLSDDVKIMVFNDIWANNYFHGPIKYYDYRIKNLAQGKPGQRPLWLRILRGIGFTFFYILKAIGILILCILFVVALALCCICACIRDNKMK